MTVNRSDFQKQTLSGVTAGDKFLVLDEGGTDEPGVVTGSALAASAPFSDAYIPKSLLTTTGDLVTNSAGSIVRVTRDVLAQDTAFSSRYVPILADVASGKYVTAPATTVTSGAPNQSRMTAAPIVIPASCTADRIGVEVTAQVAASTVRLGIYNDSAGRPGSLLVDAGTVDSSTIGVKTITISQALSPGVYWLAGCSQGGAPSVRLYADLALPTGGLSRNQLGAASFNSGGVYVDSVAGALPASFNSVDDIGSSHRVFLRLA